jgi:replicative DNA helicase
VLGGLLLDNSAWDRVSDLLTLRVTFTAMNTAGVCAVEPLINASKPADVITVFEHCKSRAKRKRWVGWPTSTHWRSTCPARATSVAMPKSCGSDPSCANWSAPATKFPPTPSIRKGRPVATIRGRSRAEDLQHRRRGRPHEAGFPGHGFAGGNLLDRVQEMADNPNDVTGCAHRVLRPGSHDLPGMQAGDHDRAGCAPVHGQNSAWRSTLPSMWH